jgi:preprotein translocase subunit SecE
MAGETRRQRRDARRAAGQESARAAAPRPVPAGPSAPAAPAHVEHPRRGGFLRESVAELRKVEWPNRAQVIQGTVVVIIACVIVGAYLWGADQVLRPFVRDVLLGQ